MSGRVYKALYCYVIIHRRICRPVDYATFHVQTLSLYSTAIAHPRPASLHATHTSIVLQAFQRIQVPRRLQLLTPRVASNNPESELLDIVLSLNDARNVLQSRQHGCELVEHLLLRVRERER